MKGGVLCPPPDRNGLEEQNTDHEDCELPMGAVTVFFCVQKGSTRMNVRKQID